MSGKVTRGLCALAAGTALAAFTSVTAGAADAAPGAARSPAAAGTGRPAGAPGSQLWVRLYNGPGNKLRRGLLGGGRPRQEQGVRDR
jgi:hypothetical protein